MRLNTMIDLNDAPLVCFMNINRYEYKYETDIGIRTKFSRHKRIIISHVWKIVDVKSIVWMAQWEIRL